VHVLFIIIDVLPNIEDLEVDSVTCMHLGMCSVVVMCGLYFTDTHHSVLRASDLVPVFV